VSESRRPYGAGLEWNIFHGLSPVAKKDAALRLKDDFSDSA